VELEGIRSGGFSPGCRVGVLTGPCARATLEQISVEQGAVTPPLILPVQSFGVS